jgi:lipopolysaccharide transport system permease protein
MAELEASLHESIIQPSKGWLRIEWRELWEYRDLLVLLVRRDITSRYKQTMLGPLWFVLQPVLTALVFALIFGRVAEIGTDGIPKPLFYLCGLLGWTYFAQNLTGAGASFVNNAHLFTKVYFPRLIVPIAIIISNLVAFALQLLPFFAFFLYYKFLAGEGASIHFTWLALLTPLPILQVAALSLGVSLWMSASTAKFRDLIHFNQFLIQIWMFGTPIIYPLSRVPERYEWLIWANPMSVPVEAFRICLLGRGALPPTAVALSVGMTILLLITGLLAFRKVERTVVDSV